MKKRLTAILLALCLVALLPLTLLGYGAALPSYYGDSYYAVLPDMVARLRDTPGKRVILLGGSNVAFGANTALMEELLSDALGEEYAVCSFGLYGAVGASAMLSLSAPHLREGDVVVLCFEPTADSQSDYFGATALWKCAEDAPGLLLSLTPGQQGAMAGSYLGYLQERAAYARAGERPAPQGAYTASAFNARCDMVYPRPGNLLPLGFDTAVAVDFSALAPAPAFAQAVRDYAAQAQRAGARVVLSFSPVNQSAVTGDPYDYFLACRRDYGLPVISDPTRYILPSGWFYDSNFHLNTAGAALRSAYLTQDILGFLGCYAPVDCPLPSMPAPIPPTPAAEDADADAFLFRPLAAGEGWAVSGLSEAGKARTALRVPALYQGKPVVALDPIPDAPLLEELTLPETVEAIPDAAFAACPGLTRLVLLHESRTPALGDAPFAGASRLRVYVPRGAWPLYREGYGCAANPWEDYLDRVTAY